MKTTKKYKVVLEVLGEEWKGEGTSTLKAIEALKVSWEEIKGKGMLALYVGGKKVHERLMVMPEIRRMINNKMAKLFVSKSLDYLAKEGNATNVPEPLEIKVK